MEWIELPCTAASRVTIRLPLNSGQRHNGQGRYGKTPIPPFNSEAKRSHCSLRLRREPSTIRLSRHSQSRNTRTQLSYTLALVAPLNLTRSKPKHTRVRLLVQSADSVGTTVERGLPKIRKNTDTVLFLVKGPPKAH